MRGAPTLRTDYGQCHGTDFATTIPVDFMFQLTRKEFENLKSQIVTSNWGGMARQNASMEKKYDGQFRVVFDAIGKPLTPPSIPTKRRIGFTTCDE
jgi:hypothetical protein